jgi:hypothetical protein
MKSELKYKRRICCFIDILGWKNLTEAAAESSSKFSVVLAILDQIREHWIGKPSQYYNEHSSREITLFSDSVVVSQLVSDKDAVAYMMMDLLHAHMAVINRGIWIRGGISVGDLYHTEQVVFGPALNEAYTLESKAARFPRIVLKSSMLDELQSMQVPELNKQTDFLRQNQLLCQAASDLLWIDYFVHGIEELDDPPSDYMEYIQLLDRNTVDIEKEGRESENPGLMAKGAWCREQVNRMWDHAGGG